MFYYNNCCRHENNYNQNENYFDEKNYNNNYNKDSYSNEKNGYTGLDRCCKREHFDKCENHYEDKCDRNNWNDKCDKKEEKRERCCHRSFYCWSFRCCK